MRDVVLFLIVFFVIYKFATGNPTFFVAIIVAVVVLSLAYAYFSRLSAEKSKADEERKNEEWAKNAKIRGDEYGQLEAIERMKEVISESVEMVNTSKNMDTRLSRIDVAISVFETMMQQFPETKAYKEDYEKLLTARFSLNRQALEESIEKHMAKARALKTLKSKINNAEKALTDVESALSNPFINVNVVEHYKQAINQFVTDAQVNDYAEKAKRYEFKGQYDKAADAYLDALFHIKNDVIDDGLQADQIVEIERLANDLRQRAKEKA